MVHFGSLFAFRSVNVVGVLNILYSVIVNLIFNSFDVEKKNLLSIFWFCYNEFNLKTKKRL